MESDDLPFSLASLHFPTSANASPQPQLTREYHFVLQHQHSCSSLRFGACLIDDLGCVPALPTLLLLSNPAALPIWTSTPTSHQSTCARSLSLAFPAQQTSETVPAQNQRVKFTSATPFTPTYVKDNVTWSSDPAQLYASRVRGRQILLDNPVRESRLTKERAAKKAARIARSARAKAGVIGQSQAREKGLWKLPQHETRCVLAVLVSSLTFADVEDHDRLSACLRPGSTRSWPSTIFGWTTWPNF